MNKGFGTKDSSSHFFNILFIDFFVIILYYILALKYKEC